MYVRGKNGEISRWPMPGCGDLLVWQSGQLGLEEKNNNNNKKKLGNKS